MGATKTGFYTEQQEAMAAITKAMGHPARIAIIQELAKNSACQCGELVLSVGLAQSTISQHLKELKNAGLIKGSVNDDRPCYCLDRDKMAEVASFIKETMLQASMQVSDCC